MGQFRRNVSSAVFRNQMEDRVLRNKLGSIELEEKRLLRRFRSETRLLNIKQEQRLGSGLTYVRKNKVNGTHNNKAGTSSTQSAGANCPLDFGKLQSSFDKRQSSTSIYACRSCPENTSDGDTFITARDGEWTQPSRRLPRLPSVNGKKTSEPLTPSKDSCQSPVNRKATGMNLPFVAQGTMTSADKAFSSEVNEAKGILGGNRGNSKSSNPLVTTEPHQKSNVPRIRRQTWNGKIITKLPESQPETARKKSFSDKDQPQIHRLSSLWDSKERTLDSCLPSDESVFVNDLNTSWNKKTFLTAEDALRKKFLSVPEQPVRKSKSMNSLKALECLPQVLESEDCHAASMGYEDDRVNEGATSGIDPLPVSGKETGNAVYDLSSQRRHQRLTRQENVTRDPSSGNASKIPTECSTESPRYGENGFGAARKVSVKYKIGQPLKYMHRTWQAVNKHGELTKKETTETKKQREKRVTRSNFFSSSLDQSSKEEIQIEIPKRKEYVKPKKGVLNKGLETKDEEEKAPMDRQNWMKALKKVCNANIFLSGMVALRKQRERYRLVLKMKQDALEKLFQELKHCRYLRLPCNEDDEKIDFVSWVFQKD